jgi:hypothetical protein
MYLLQPTIYETEDPLHQSDQITVSPDIWSEIYETSAALQNNTPIFFSVNDDELVCRIRPDTALRGTDSMCMPMWMWMRLGAPDPDYWMTCRVCPTIPHIATVTLRARVEASLTSVEDPVEMLTAALSGQGDNPSWACLNVGSELPLTCGVFDVMDLLDTQGNHVSSGCILDRDVHLELLPALDHVLEPVPPPPTPAFPILRQHTPSFSSGSGRMSDVSAGSLPSPDLEPTPNRRPIPPLHRNLQRRGLLPVRREYTTTVPFSGKAYRLGDPI